jgi:ribonuclease P protein component
MSMSPFGFPRQRKLLLAKEFASLARLGRRSFTGHFIVYIMPNQLQFSRLGVSINARSGNAVKRNRLKRALREFFRQNQDSIQIPVDIHVAVKRGVLATRAAAKGVVEAELREFFINTTNHISAGIDVPIKDEERSKGRP